MFGNRLKKLREQKGISQRDLAKLIQLSPSTVAMYELNQRSPDKDTLVNLADFFNVSVDYLLGRTDDPSPRPKIETIAAHRTDDPMDDLPPEARRSVEEFIDYIYKKYGKKKE